MPSEEPPPAQQPPAQQPPAQRRRGPLNGGAFVLVFLFVWIVFDNLALALIFGLFALGGAEAAQRAVRSPPR